MARKYTVKIDGNVIGTRTSQNNKYTHAVCAEYNAGWKVWSYHTRLDLAQKARDTLFNDAFGAGSRWFGEKPKSFKVVKVEGEELPKATPRGASIAAKAVLTKQANRWDKSAERSDAYAQDLEDRFAEIVQRRLDNEYSRMRGRTQEQVEQELRDQIAQHRQYARDARDRAFQFRAERAKLD